MKQWWSYCSHEKYIASNNYGQSLEELSSIMPNKTFSSPALFTMGASKSYKKKENMFALAECHHYVNT
jgi:hypothetical protein